MAILTVYTPGPAGAVVPSVVPSLAGDSFPNNGRSLVIFQNGGGAPQTVTFAATGVLANGAVVANVAMVVTNGTVGVAGPFPPEQFNDANGRVAITYSGNTSTLIRVVST